MENSNILLSLTPIPFFSVIIWIILMLSAAYFARKPFHRSMASFSRIVYSACRLAAVSVKLAEGRLRTRNRHVLLASGLELAERKVEREFDRISLAVQRDLEGYPQLKRKMNEDLQCLEDDYEKSLEIPQALPDWVSVIDAIANIRPVGDRVVVNILEEIHKTISEQHKAAAERHRRNVSERHEILNRMLPVWRGLHKTLVGMDKNLISLKRRSKKIDRYMDEYEKIRTNTEIAERQLSSSSLTQFFVSGLVLAVAAVGAMINFNLVALPMSEMVGGASYIGGFKTSDVAGMFIVCLEIVVGIFLMDSLRITRLFSIIGSLEDNQRKIIFWILLTMLTILAGVESSLAFMRDRIAADMEALRQSLAGVEATAVATSSIPTIGQMIMGFILPFILTFVAIPFESFVSSSRTVLGVVGAGVLQILAFFLRLLGNIGFYLGRLIVNIYDLVVFPGLWLEGLIVGKKGQVSGERPQKEKSDQAVGHVMLMEGTTPWNESTK